MRPLPLTFTGSPEDLRRHGSRDLLINIVLGGLYTPIARRHTAAYLAAHTSIDDTPLIHVPATRTRWRAILLVFGFIGLRLANAFELGPTMPIVIVYGVLLIPYLWGIVASRRVRSVRWRQLQPWFKPQWREVYLQSWPLLLLGAAWAIAQPLVPDDAPELGDLDLRWLAVSAAAAAIAFPLLARQGFNYLRLRLTHTRVGGSLVVWEATFATYLRLWLVTGAAVLVTAVAPVLLLRQALFGSLADLPQTQADLVYLAAIVLAWLLSVPARAWYEARLFMLTWNGLRVDDRLQVQCEIDARSFVAMRTKNAWRALLTFGFHHPRAVVAAYRAKLAALRVWSA
ncbi:DUF898 family protein [Ramlibacter alkalitolerans]|uniref:DUF898 family protein n=1 Tax=Ramlibacter alkalitolerans TaxID=2039631 RepID=A0ABS1JNZ1_9BURK|nr:DUF898 family protein [Ramlibacter alkalitolerans]MBL0425861.1 DUF898 family protein [Ramlibacter alkalitolerans]